MALASPSSSWKSLLVGAAFDTANDQQANSDNDLVGDASNPMLQAQASGSGDASILYFRARMGDSNPKTTLFLGFDLNRDGRVDIFVEANVKASTPYVSFHKSDPTKSGISPSQTGWLNSPSNLAIETQLASADSYIALEAASGDVDNNRQNDVFIDFGFKFSSLKSFANTLGFDAVSLESTVSVFLFTSTGQTANGDIGGIDDNASGVKDQSWASLGIVPSGSIADLSSGAILDPTVASLSTTNTTPTLTGT